VPDQFEMITSPSHVKIESIVRRLRGGSQAYFVKGNDGRCYAAKFRDNPQGNRSLINEWISHRLFVKLGIATPRVRLLSLEGECARNPALHFAIGDKKRPIKPGIHFGSEFPVDPDTVAIFDFLPSRLLATVSNLSDFGRVLVLDRWLCQNDSRQVIFFRERSGGSPMSMRAVFIDNGFCLGGTNWEVSDSNLRGLYYDRTVYSKFNLMVVCQQTTEAVRAINEEEIYACCDDIPEQWLQVGDGRTIKSVLTKLLERRCKLDVLVEQQLATLTSMAPVKSFGLVTKIGHIGSFEK
jgi:hypothetical protein